MMRGVALLLAFTPLFAQTQQAIVSVCDIVREPQGYNGRFVTLRGRFVQDEHGWAFYEAECPKEISWVAPRSPIRSSVDEMALITEFRRRTKRTDLVQITAKGVFRFVEKPAAWTSQLELEVTDVSLDSMVVTPR